MSKAIRQENLYGAEDWTLVYTSFKNAEFKSYDFDTLRQSMVDYMQVNFAEEFNDYIQNSEFIALLDLVAFTGQNLAFRMDLNARENILDTAEKRESVLRIARMLSYKPKRVRPAQGMLKITSVTTTEQVIDSLGVNLSNQTQVWGSDPSELAYERFVKVLNSAFNRLNPYGTPVQRVSNTETGIVYEIYNFNNTDALVSVPMSAYADGITVDFDLVPLTLDRDGVLTQKEPDIESAFSVMYRNDGKGSGSNKTGFFIMAKQGQQINTTQQVSGQQSNIIIDLPGTQNISEEDFYVQTVDEFGTVLKSWSRVSNLDFNNIVVNSYSNQEKDLYEVIYSDADVTSIKFGDGIFSNTPAGLIKIWYRISENDYVRVKAGEINNVDFQLNYMDQNSQIQTMFMTLELQENMLTGLPAESLDEIKQNAPEAFYSKNRMVTADDYNGFLPTLNNDVLLMKAENRTFSGHTRYVDIKDPTGKSRSLIEFADDGYIYKEEKLATRFVADVASTRLVDFLDEYLERQLADVGLLNFYYGKLDVVGDNSATKFPTIRLGDTIYHTRTVNAIGLETEIPTIIPVSLNTADPYDSFDIDGGLIKIDSELLTYDSIVSGKFIGVRRAQHGTAIQPHAAGTKITKVLDYRWVPVYSSATGSNGYFSPNNDSTVPEKLGYSSGGDLRNIRPGALVKLVSNTGSYIWTSILDVRGDGLGIEDIDGNYTGKLPNGFGPVELGDAVTDNRLVTEILTPFPRIFDTATRQTILSRLNDNLTNTGEIFGLVFNNLTPNWTVVDDIDVDAVYDSSNISSSWLMYVVREASGWTIVNRQLDYIFGSEELIRFYNINFAPNFNINFKNVSKDNIQVMGLNSAGKLEVKQTYRITGYYVYDDGYTDNSKVKITPLDLDGDFLPDDPEGFSKIVGADRIDLAEYSEGDFSYTVPNTFGGEVVETVDGTQGLVFKWDHKTGADQTLNPSLTNIIDAYVLTKSYNEDFNTWKRSNSTEVDRPLPPTTEELRSNFLNLNTFKMMTDEIIFHPVKFKPLFGLLSDSEFQAQFKVVKNSKSKLTDNEIKSKVINAIDAFFAPGNFDFGETFYFTELAAYIHRRLETDLSSVLIVPISIDGRFGTLFQIQPDRDEVVTSVATVNDVIVINEITDSNIRIGR
jgi:hypothetical protein